MQALIDFDGWRRWKDFATSSDTTAGTSKLSTSYSAIAPRKGKTPVSTTQAANPTNGEGPSNSDGVVAKPKDEEKKMKRRSMGILPPPTLPEEKSLADADSPGV
jgi:osomolarity two-component system response regulator SSK1